MISGLNASLHLLSAEFSSNNSNAIIFCKHRNTLFNHSNLCMLAISGNSTSGKLWMSIKKKRLCFMREEGLDTSRFSMNFPGASPAQDLHQMNAITCLTRYHTNFHLLRIWHQVHRRRMANINQQVNSFQIGRIVA